MREIALFMMVSVDGNFEAPGHDLSWHNVDAEFNAFAVDQLAHAGMLLFGHRTYDLMAGYWPTHQGAADDLEVAKLMNELPKAVVAHKAFDAAWNSTSVISADAAGGDIIAAIRELKNALGGEILLLGSNALCVSLMEAGLVDEFRIMISPVAIGAGTPLFAGLSKRLPLKLAETHAFASGNILNRYRPR